MWRTKSVLEVKSIWRHCWKIAGGGWRPMSNAKTTCRSIKLRVIYNIISDRLKALGKAYKERKWVSNELKPRNIERQKTICEILLARQQRKKFLHRIVTSDEKCIYFNNPKCRKTVCDPGQPSTSTPKRNIRGKKAMLCIWWDQKGVVYHELSNEIWSNNHRESLPRTNYQFEPSITRKTTRIWNETA